ncbi:MAG: hypothetical protein JOZ11_07285 [Alphaproteobacteria bacterium]|nr:hypothetical protein [Alphaproteobacteria bacterium]
MLNVDGATHRVDGTVELHEKSVALAAGKSASMSSDRWFDEILDAIAQMGVGALFVDAH